MELERHHKAKPTQQPTEQSRTEPGTESGFARISIDLILKGLRRKKERSKENGSGCCNSDALGMNASSTFETRELYGNVSCCSLQKKRISV